MKCFLFGSGERLCSKYLTYHLLPVLFSSLSWPLFPRALPLNRQLPPCLRHPGISICSLSKQQNPKSRQRNNSPKTPSYPCMAQEPCSSKALRVNHFVKVSVQPYFKVYLEQLSPTSVKLRSGTLLPIFKWRFFLFLPFTKMRKLLKCNTEAKGKNSVRFSFIYSCSNYQVSNLVKDLWIRLV